MKQLRWIAALIAQASIVLAAHAQTPDAIVLYGRVYVMVESVEAPGGAAPVVRRNRVSDQSSLLGVRATEDLGHGLKAFFQLETPFMAEQNNTSFASRNSGVGLENSFGSVLLGRWDTPFRFAGAIDAFGDLTIAGYAAAMSDRGNFKRREQNVLQYWSPALAGFAARLHYSADEGRTATRDPDVAGASLTYSTPGVFLGYAYEKHRDVAEGVSESGHQAGGNVHRGPWKVGLLYQQFSKTRTRMQKSFMANLVYTAGNHRLIYQHQLSKDGGATAAALQPRCNVDSVGYQYIFTRRTHVMVLYTRTNNNDAASCNFGSNNLAIAPGQDPRGFAAGVRHIF